MRSKIFVSCFVALCLIALLSAPILAVKLAPGKVSLLGKAKRARAEQQYSFNTIYDLTGHAQASLTKCLNLTIRGKQISPIPNVSITNLTDLTNAYVKTAGDDILVPTATQPSEVPKWGTASWDMDPLTGFTPAKLQTFLGTYGSKWISWQGTVAPFASIVQAQAILLSAGIGEYDRRIQNEVTFPGTMPKPADFSSEDNLSKLAESTYLVEFSVPASPIQEAIKPGIKQFLTLPPPYGLGIPVDYIRSINPYLLDPAETSYKLRGWFIKGDGIQTDSGSVVHPLVILSFGPNFSSFLHPLSTDVSNNCRMIIGWRKLAYYLATQGYNVLLYDHEVKDVSTGWNQAHDWSDPSIGGDGTGNAVNIFHMIKELAGESIPNPFPQLGGDATLKMTAYDATGATPYPGKLIDSSTTPVILFGYCRGAMISERAMQLYVDNVNGIKSSFNLRGVAEIGSASGCIKFTDDYGLFPPAGDMGFEAALQATLKTSFLPDSDVFASMDKWPGYLTIKGIYDALTPDGAVEAYNRVRGFKDVLMVYGNHLGYLYAPNFPYVANKLESFCKKVTINDPSMNNQGKTTLWPEIAKAPPIDLGLLWDYMKDQTGNTPAPMGVLKGQEQKYENALKSAVDAISKGNINFQTK